MSFKIEEIELFDKEQREFLDEDKIREQVDRIYLQLSQKLGSGKTAEVVFVPKYNSKICYKIISERRFEDLYEDMSNVPKFNSPKIESYFLAKAEDSAKEVKIPKPICYWEGESDSLGKFKVLIMENLDAFTIQDVLYGVEKLGEDFDISSFERDLTDFIQRLNETSGIIHGDITVTNIMIERGTNRPCVIDFGDSERVFGDEKPSTRDKTRLKEVIISLKNHLENTRANNPTFDKSQ